MAKREYKYGDLVHYSFDKFQKGFAIFLCDRPELGKAILEMQKEKIIQEVYYEKFYLADKKDGTGFLNIKISMLENQIERLKHQIESKALRIERNKLKIPMWEAQVEILKTKTAKYEVPLRLLGKTKNNAPDVLQMKSRLNNLQTNINRCKNCISVSRSQNYNMTDEINGLIIDVIGFEGQLKMWKERKEQFLSNF
jgi:chromosome segregation ATPase